MADEVKKANWFNPSLNWRERGLPKPGRKADYARLVIKNRFGLTERQMRNIGPCLRDKIVQCEDNGVIRLMLGVSR